MSLPHGLIRCMILLPLAASTAWASAIVSDSLSLTQLLITPAAGSLQVIPNLTTFAQALDSLGGFDQSAANPAFASTPFANGSASASASALTASVSAGIDVPDIGAFASSEGQALLYGTFEITGATGPVSVNLSASLAIDQMAATSGGGESAFSDATFTLTLPDVNSSPILSFANPQTLGPNQTYLFTNNPSLTTNLVLQAGTSYSFYAALDTDPSGSTTVPEPSLFLPLAVGLSALLRGRGWRAKAPFAD